MSNDNWTTPAWLFRYLNKRFNFQLDAAATKDNALCARFYDEESNGLKQPWADEGFTFCNPPYSRVGEWVEKAAREWTNCGRRSMSLIPVRADQGWWHEYVISELGEVEWYKGRIYFGESTGSAWMYSVNLIYGAHLAPVKKIQRSIWVESLRPPKGSR